MTTHFVGEPDDHRSDAELPCDAWALGDVPSPGHTFWMTGDVNLTIGFPGAQTLERALDDELSLASISPQMEVRGARLDRAGVELLIYERALRAGSAGSEAGSSVGPHEASTNERKVFKPRGRTPGSGSYAPADAPLLDEMRRSIVERKAMSVHRAAALVADRAHGAGTIESKASRLARAYRAMEWSGAKK
jgi:hypothetical protein